MDNPTDARHFAQLDADARHEAAISAAQSEIYEALLATGHADVDDERLLLNIDADKMREAYRLYADGARDQAVLLFVYLFRDAADKTASEEAEEFVASRQAESRTEAASERYDALKENGRIA